MDPILLITNAEAGSADDETLKRALEVLRAATDVEVCTTSNPGELDGVLHRRGSRMVVVAGGDGSLHAVVAALHRRHELDRVVLGLIPLGTGNDFARGAEIPLDPEEAARVVVKGHSRRLDLIVDCVGEVVVNNIHIGVGAEASRKSGTWKKRLGRAGYLVGAAAVALNPPFVRLRIEVDGEEVTSFDRPVLQVAIGNGSNVGGGTALTPEANPADGKMDVMVSYAISPTARFGYALHLRSGRHHEREDVLYVRGSQVSVSGQEFFCSADGELVGPERNLTWHVEGDAFSMVLPG
jgi:YegS/Rv2252/BmrU family lipid kinase